MTSGAGSPGPGTSQLRGAGTRLAGRRGLQRQGDHVADDPRGFAEQDVDGLDGFELLGGFERFQAVRRRLDPDGKFTNAYVDRVLGRRG